MKRKSIIIAAALAATVGAGALALSGTSFAQPYGGMGPGMMGGGGPGYGSGQGYGPGMMGGGGPGYGGGQGYGPGMMGGYGPGYMHGQGGQGGGYGPGYMHGQGGYGPGWMHGQGGYGPGWMHGGRGYGPCANNEANAGQQQDLKLTTDDVKTRMERWLTTRNNPRLKVGDVKEKDADTITADIVTVDNSLVQRIDINRHTGVYSPEQGN